MSHGMFAIAGFMIGAAIARIGAAEPAWAMLIIAGLATAWYAGTFMGERR